MLFFLFQLGCSQRIGSNNLWLAKVWAVSKRWFLLGHKAFSSLTPYFPRTTQFLFVELQVSSNVDSGGCKMFVSLCINFVIFPTGPPANT
jgi:hypothetical protein